MDLTDSFILCILKHRKIIVLLTKIMQTFNSLLTHVEFRIFCVMLIGTFIETILWKTLKLHKRSYSPDNDYTGDEGTLSVLYWIALITVPIGMCVVCLALWAHAPMWGKH
ncbi:MAG: hypothetical protein RLZZ347_706 [Candidatus Parcubacteria bacterium]|jgi:hypothetical protein